MATRETATLRKLTDTNSAVADPAEDVRERKVLDKTGGELGTVDDLLIDDRDRKVRFLQVAAGGLLGLGETKFLVPVDAITRISSEAVHIDQTREHVTGGRRYDPTLVSERQWTELYRHYGYTPYWEAGYVYPAYPFYP
jgi:sporulation protein YlmC with PRC-barrel domain